MKSSKRGIHFPHFLSLFTQKIVNFSRNDVRAQNLPTFRFFFKLLLQKNGGGGGHRVCFGDKAYWKRLGALVM